MAKTKEVVNIESKDFWYQSRCEHSFPLPENLENLDRHCFHDVVECAAKTLISEPENERYAKHFRSMLFMFLMHAKYLHPKHDKLLDEAHALMLTHHYKLHFQDV